MDIDFLKEKIKNEIGVFPSSLSKEQLIEEYLLNNNYCDPLNDEFCDDSKKCVIKSSGKGICISDDIKAAPREAKYKRVTIDGKKYIGTVEALTLLNTKLKNKAAADPLRSELMKMDINSLRRKIVDEIGVYPSPNNNKKQLIDEYLLNNNYCDPMHDEFCDDSKKCILNNNPSKKGLCVSTDIPSLKKANYKEMVINGKKYVGSSKALALLNIKLTRPPPRAPPPIPKRAPTPPPSRPTSPYRNITSPPPKRAPPPLPPRPPSRAPTPPPLVPKRAPTPPPSRPTSPYRNITSPPPMRKRPPPRVPTPPPKPPPRISTPPAPKRAPFPKETPKRKIDHKDIEKILKEIKVADTRDNIDQINFQFQRCLGLLSN